MRVRFVNMELFFLVPTVSVGIHTCAWCHYYALPRGAWEREYTKPFLTLGINTCPSLVLFVLE